MFEARRHACTGTPAEVEAFVIVAGEVYAPIQAREGGFFRVPFELFRLIREENPQHNGGRARRLGMS